MAIKTAETTCSLTVSRIQPGVGIRSLITRTLTPGSKCASRGASITDVWIIDRDHGLVQYSYEYNTSSTSEMYPPGV